MLTIESLDCQGVVCGQSGVAEREPLVFGVHEGRGVSGVGQAQGVAQLMGCHGDQIEACRGRERGSLEGITTTALLSSDTMTGTWFAVIHGPSLIVIKVHVSPHALARLKGVSQHPLGAVEGEEVSMNCKTRENSELLLPQGDIIDLL